MAGNIARPGGMTRRNVFYAVKRCGIKIARGDESYRTTANLRVDTLLPWRATA